LIRKLVALCLIAGCTTETPVSVVPVIAATDYTCADGAKISAVYSAGEPSQAIVTVDGKTVTLTQVISASGVRYADETEGSKLVWWTKGNDGTLYIKKAGDENIVHADCMTK
jgi:membrane-bound inhibitor of C-type lysozyme